MPHTAALEFSQDSPKLINKLFSEIIKYNGNFGDPVVDFVDFDPIEMLESKRNGIELLAGVGLLVNFSSHIDNTTYEDALQGKGAKDIKISIAQGYCSKYPEIFLAFNCVFVSELKYQNQLEVVYNKYIKF